MAFAVRAFQSRLDFADWTSGRRDGQRAWSSDTDFAYLAPAARPYENWMPGGVQTREVESEMEEILPPAGDERGDEDRQAKSDYGWNVTTIRQIVAAALPTAHATALNKLFV